MCLNTEQILCYVAVISRAFRGEGGEGWRRYQEKGGNQTIEQGKEVSVKKVLLIRFHTRM